MTDLTEGQTMAEDVAPPTRSDELRGRIADVLAVWPYLAVSIQVAPWHWRLDFYRDVIERGGHVTLGPLKVEWFANTPAFPTDL